MNGALFCSAAVVFLFSLLLTMTRGQDAYPGEPAPPPPPAPVYGPPAKAPSVPGYPAAVQVGPPQYMPAQPPLRETSYGGCAGGGGECPTENGFPLPTCYLNKDGFMCCNKQLENLLDNTYRNISKSRGGKWKRCNLHQVAVATQRNAEKLFGVDFETVVGAGDFAAKNYFNQDLICKIKRENSIIMAFASPA
uniref:Ground-like domain-containing protein n=1 Tax=Globodera rostochiensis TaxID=31243 RepID=A0A914I094_GLORO